MKKQKTSKIWLIFSLTCLSIVILLVVVFILPNFLKEYSPAVSNVVIEEIPQKQNLGVSLIYVEGAVETKNANGLWQRAQVGDILVVGSQVEILGAGKAILNFDDGSLLRLNSNSKLTLTSLDPNQYHYN